MKEAKMSYLQKKSADLNEDDVVKMYEELTYEFSDDLNIQIALATYLGKQLFPFFSREQNLDLFWPPSLVGLYFLRP